MRVAGERDSNERVDGGGGGYRVMERRGESDAVRNEGEED